MSARLVVLGCMVALAVSACFNEPRVYREELRMVPDVTGERVADARIALEAEGFGVLVVSEESEDEVACPSGEVAAQDPVAAQEVLAASTITLVARGC